MQVIFQKGNILTSPPRGVYDIDYVVIRSDTGVVCAVLKTLDDKSVLYITPQDKGFEETLVALGLEKNQTDFNELSL